MGAMRTDFHETLGQRPDKEKWQHASMTFTTTTWTTITATPIHKPDYSIHYRTPDGAEGDRAANMLLTQTNDTGGRRTILGAVDLDTGEVIAAPDVPGYTNIVSRWLP